MRPLRYHLIYRRADDVYRQTSRHEPKPPRKVVFITPRPRFYIANVLKLRRCARNQ